MAAMSMVAALTQMGIMFPPNSVMWYPGAWQAYSAIPKSKFSVD